MKKIIRTATIALSLDVLLKGQLAFLSDKFTVIAVSGNDKHLNTVQDREGVKTINVAFQRKISPLKDIVSLLNLYRVLRKEKPLIVHSITPKAGLITMVAGYFARVPIRMHTFTGLIFPTKKGVVKQLLIFMDKILCLFATNIYPEGQGVKNDLQQYKITKKELNILANGNVNGIDTNYFNPTLFSEDEKNTLRKSLNINPTDFVFIFVGRLVEDKGINELITAFSLLSANISNVKLLLVGPLEQDINPIKQSTLLTIKNNASICKVGYQEDVRPFFSVANCLVFPSYREGFPNVVLQAGAMNLPSIVTNINGCNEIIENLQNGIIIPVKNEIAILNAMQLVLNDKQLYNSLKRQARFNITIRYEQKIVWAALLQEYKRLKKNV